MKSKTSKPKHVCPFCLGTGVRFYAAKGLAAVCACCNGLGHRPIKQAKAAELSTRSA